MSSLRVVTNGVTGLHANPLRNRAVLLLLFAQDFLDFKVFGDGCFFTMCRKERETLRVSTRLKDKKKKTRRDRVPLATRARSLEKHPRDVNIDDRKTRLRAASPPQVHVFSRTL